MSYVPIDSVASSASQIKDDRPQVFRRRAFAESSTARRIWPSQATSPRSIPIEIAFLLDHGAPEQALEFAAATARRQGVCADEALLAEGLVSEDVFYRSLARHLNVDFIDRAVDVCASGASTAGHGYARIRDPSSGVHWLFAPSGSGVFRLMSACRAAEARTFASQTFEEAPATFGALVRQRTRWFKGWMQTFIVHCRRPVQLFVDLGSRRALAVLAMFAGGLFGPLLGPLLAARLTYDAIFGALLAPVGLLEIALSTLWCFLAFAGGISLFFPLAVGMRRRSLARFRRSLIYLPLWQIMLSVAAWRALFELWRRPFHWEKTEHGLTARGVLDAERPINPFCSIEQPLFNQESRA